MRLPYVLGAEMLLHPPTEVLAVGQLLPFSISMKVFEVVGVGEDDVSETVILTEVERAGTVNLYHTSRLLPQLGVPVTVLAAALYSVPAVEEQSAPGVNVTALTQLSFTGCEKDARASNSNTERIKGFFIGWTFRFVLSELPQDIYDA
jgi:hypothetical protein